MQGAGYLQNLQEKFLPIAILTSNWQRMKRECQNIRKNQTGRCDNKTYNQNLKIQQL
jgi:hypothetical protein